jgi:hypothetical protein
MIQMPKRHARRPKVCHLHLLLRSLGVAIAILLLLPVQADADFRNYWPRYPTDAEIKLIEKDFADRCRPDNDKSWSQAPHFFKRPADATVRSFAVKRHNKNFLKGGFGPYASSEILIVVQVYWPIVDPNGHEDYFFYECFSDSVEYKNGRFAALFDRGVRFFLPPRDLREPGIRQSPEKQPSPDEILKDPGAHGRHYGGRQDVSPGFAPLSAAEDKVRKPPCAAAVRMFGLTSSSQTNMTMDYDDIRQQFEQAIAKFDGLHPSQPTSFGKAEFGMAPLLSWMANQGGTFDFVSKYFVFATDDDRATWQAQSKRPAAQLDQVRKGTERQLYNEMHRLFVELNKGNTSNKKKKLTPGNIFYLALEQRNGNAKEAMLLAHNTLRSLARVNDGPFTDVYPSLGVFDEIIEPLIDPEPLGRGQNAGAVYHLFGTAAVEMSAKDNWSLNLLATYSIDMFGEAMKEKIQAMLQKLKDDPKLELPSTRSSLSIFANEFEQAARKLKWGSPDDPDKYCYNIFGAQIGAWLHDKLIGKREVPNLNYPIGAPASRVPTLVHVAMSPMDIEWQGNGYRMVFRQKTLDFEGYYPLQLFPFYEAGSGTWGMAWTDLLDKPYKVTLRGSDVGAGHVLSLDMRQKANHTTHRISHLPLQPGRQYDLEIEANAERSVPTDSATGMFVLSVDLTQALAPAKVAPPAAPGGLGASRAGGGTPQQAPPPAKSPPIAGKPQRLFTLNNPHAVQNHPVRETVMTLSTSAVLTKIVTYHWNNGAGTSAPGTILLRSQSGKVFGPWQAEGEPGQGGVPNAYWVCYPNLSVPAGTYRVIDSDPATWSQNAVSGHAGMSWAEGYPR